jgi:hypothetical protein
VRRRKGRGGSVDVLRLSFLLYYLVLMCLKLRSYPPILRFHGKPRPFVTNPCNWNHSLDYSRTVG